MASEFPVASGGFQNTYGTRIPWTTRIDGGFNFDPQRRCRCTPAGSCGGGCASSGEILSEDAFVALVSSRGAKNKTEREKTRSRVLLDYDSEPNDISRSEAVNSLTTDGVNDIVNQRANVLGNRRDAESETLSEIFTLSNASFNLREQLTERNPGGAGRIIGGRLVNSVLGNIDVPVGVSEEGMVFGPPALTISQNRADVLNGFGPETVTGYIYNQRGPGSVGRPFERDVFLVDLANSRTHPWADRIRQTAGNISCETRNMCLAINGMAGRTLYLVRRPQPYYFIFRPASQNPNLTRKQCEEIDECDEVGFYITTDPVGGDCNSFLNGVDETRGIAPQVFPLTRTVFDNNSVYSLIVDDNWPDVLFYQSTLGPFMGGLIVVLGKYP